MSSLEHRLDQTFDARLRHDILNLDSDQKLMESEGEVLSDYCLKRIYQFGWIHWHDSIMYRSMEYDGKIVIMEFKGPYYTRIIMLDAQGNYTMETVIVKGRLE